MKQVRKFEHPKMVKFKDLLPYSVVNLEYGDYGNFVDIIVKGMKVEDNGSLCILFSFPATPNKVDKMYQLKPYGRNVLDEKVKLVGSFA